MFSKEEIALGKVCYEAIKKISKGKWEWEPEVGEWCIVWDKAVLIYKVYDDKVVVNLGQPEHRAKNVIPLLHWERIEEILLRCPVDGGCWNFYEPFKFIPDICRGKFMRWKVEYMWRYERTGVCPTKHWEWGKTRQEAVRKAVIKLAKETK